MNLGFGIAVWGRQQTYEQIIYEHQALMQVLAGFALHGKDAVI